MSKVMWADTCWGWEVGEKRGESGDLLAAVNDCIGAGASPESIEIRVGQKSCQVPDLNQLEIDYHRVALVFDAKLVPAPDTRDAAGWEIDASHFWRVLADAGVDDEEFMATSQDHAPIQSAVGSGEYRVDNNNVRVWIRNTWL